MSLTAAILVVLALLAGMTIRARRRGTGRPAGALTAQEPWDGPAELASLLAENGEVRSLYARLGFLPDVERACEALLADLKGLVRVEVPDFAALTAALDRLAASSSSLSSSAPPERNAELLRRVLAVRGDREAVLALLGRAPVDEALPFVEQLPLVRQGEVTWRTPVELTLLRKRPADLEAFEQRLDELERLVRAAPLRREARLRAELLEALARVRRDAHREDAYLPTSLQGFEPLLRDWLHRSRDPAALDRRHRLDELLMDVLRLRRDGTSPATAEKARSQAQLYAGSPWMQTPWITTLALANLLNAEIALLPPDPAERKDPTAPAALLRRVRDEIASGHFDGDETIRRLRQQEESGLFVHSLVYALLRLARLPGGDE
ncbi:MAG TPA: hypothetical protein VLV54_06715 [Thermoanaerobaculia bacterium]|nr:hypothetical protein [Thermoanaerobaculia bacterium]